METLSTNIESDFSIIPDGASFSGVDSLRSHSIFTSTYSDMAAGHINSRAVTPHEALKLAYTRVKERLKQCEHRMHTQNLQIKNLIQARNISLSDDLENSPEDAEKTKLLELQINSLKNENSMLRDKLGESSLTEEGLVCDNLDGCDDQTLPHDDEAEYLSQLLLMETSLSTARGEIHKLHNKVSEQTLIIQALVKAKQDEKRSSPLDITSPSNSPAIPPASTQFCDVAVQCVPEMETAEPSNHVMQQSANHITQPTNHIQVRQPGTDGEVILNGEAYWTEDVYQYPDTGVTSDPGVSTVEAVTTEPPDDICVMHTSPLSFLKSGSFIDYKSESTGDLGIVSGIQSSFMKNQKTESTISDLPSSKIMVSNDQIGSQMVNDESPNRLNPINHDSVKLNPNSDTNNAISIDEESNFVSDSSGTGSVQKLSNENHPTRDDKLKNQTTSNLDESTLNESSPQVDQADTDVVVKGAVTSSDSQPTLQSENPTQPSCPVCGLVFDLQMTDEERNEHAYNCSELRRDSNLGGVRPCRDHDSDQTEVKKGYEEREDPGSMGEDHTRSWVKVCPICHISFPGETEQSVFEQHVNFHFHDHHVQEDFEILN